VVVATGGLPRARVDLRVRPGASRTRVGGSHGGRLVVAVSERAVDGAATTAALRALADALGVRPRHVRLVLGATSRDKVVEVEGVPPDELVRRIEELLRDGG
jgi:uncharacterized protein YggU (UPF0235/DUF167 family)